MTISFQNALGIHPQSLTVRIERAEILANNLANADTPGYKARDLDFKAILSGELDSVGGNLGLERTNGNHLPVSESAFQGDLKYRVPLQPSLDGNTVDTQLETAEFTKNVLDFQSSFQFLSARFQGLSGAIRGE